MRYSEESCRSLCDVYAKSIREPVDEHEAKWRMACIFRPESGIAAECTYLCPYVLEHIMMMDCEK